MKTSRKVISLLLSVIMFMTCFAVALPNVTIEAEAQGETINGITQTRIVPDGTYQAVYASYASAYLSGFSEPTELVIPGLSEANNYVVQGMTYYPQKNWVLITAYHNSDSPSPSMVYCIDVATGDFVAMFSFLNVDGTANTDHGGGIAVSENNIYYSCGDMDRSIAYAPLSAIEGIENDASKYRTVQLVAEQTFYEVGSVADGDATAYTAYCCYDQGVLWMGNFYDEGTLGGLIAADYDVPAHSSYNSMVWGYELSGSNSAEEWANLTSNTNNCQGNPSYVIALPNDIIDVQYATVDDGRLYLSRSYGTGTETCINFGMSEYSQLSIADIDLTVSGTGTLTFTTDANGTQRTVTDAYIVPSMQTFDFMPMSEGLCVIDDYIYMTFESACFKYYQDAGIMGNCNLPVDVVWKIDQYGLLGHERPDEEDVTAYQKVNYVSEIDSTEEYIVVYESDMLAEGNQNNILYALNTYGGYQGDKLPKTDAGTATNTMDSMGMVGHEITDHHKYTNADGTEFLILGDAEKDDEPNIRWNLIGASTGSMRLHSVDLYNAEYSYLYFDSRLIYMSTEGNTSLDNIALANKVIDGVEYPGEFWLYNSASSSYLWCNDGSDDAIMKAYNDYYMTGDVTHKYFEQTEIPGTFHADALKLADSANSGNQATALSSPYKLGTFNIYKRITIDPETMGGTGLETDLDAELQADGTYTINMGTYATSEAHKYLGESGYPTDFMFVLDASGSMTNNSDYVTYQNQGNLDISRGMANDDTGYYVYVDEVIKSDGTVVTVNQFCRLNGHYSGFLINVKYWVGAEAQNGSGEEYMLDTDGTFKWSADDITKVSGSDTTITNAHAVYRKVTTTRLQGMKDTVNNFITKIDNNAQTYNIEHRVAITQFGSDGADTNSTAYRNTGMYSTLNGTTMNQYGTDVTAEDYASAFYPSNHSNLKTIVNAIDTTTEDPDTYSNLGFEMAINGLAAQSPQYGGAGDRYYEDWTDAEGILHEKNANAVVIFITDGVPGVGGTDSATATTVANQVLPYAKTIKDANGYVYSVQISDATMDGFDMASYMNGTSSNYPGATSLTALGTAADSAYYVKAATDGTVDVQDVLDGVFTHIEDTLIDVGTAITLGTNSIVRQVLGSNFKLTSESSVTTSTSSISEDVLGNIKFGDNVATSGVTATPDVANNTVQVTGFDYSSNYYAKNAKEGQRLNIVIDNVLPVDSDESSMDISNQTYTAIYESADALSSNKKFKGYPNAAFSIPEYTYVLDYGMDMLDTDVNGTLKSVSDDLSKQADASGNLLYNTSDDDNAVTISDNSLNLIYNVKLNQTAVDKNYVLIQRDDGTYDWFQINVAPASNIYFEETSASDTASTNGDWAAQGTATITTQDVAVEDTDVYGYDSNYETSANGFSNGTVSKATIASTAKRSDTKTFTFTGTGFDLVSACGVNTGIMTVKVTNTATGAVEKMYVVDTYYRDTTYVNSDGLLCQVPVVSFTNGTTDAQEYTVETTAVYLTTSNALKPTAKSTASAGKLTASTGVAADSAAIAAELEALGLGEFSGEEIELVWFDDNSVLNGGTGAKSAAKSGAKAAVGTDATLYCYYDGFRIYHPLGMASSNYAASEQHATYTNVINNIGNGVSSDTDISSIAYVETAADGTLAFANYETTGPENELYLKPGTGALAFNVQLSNTSKVHLGLRAVTGTATVTIGSGDTATVFNINSATEMYYDVTDLLAVDSSTGVATITVQCTSGVLAVNNIKMTQNAAVAATAEEDLEMFTLAMAAPVETATVMNGRVVVDTVEEDTTTGDDANADTDTDTDGTTDDTTNDTATESEGSLLDQIIALIMQILSQILGSLAIGG